MQVPKTVFRSSRLLWYLSPNPTGAGHLGRRATRSDRNWQCYGGFLDIQSAQNNSPYTLVLGREAIISGTLEVQVSEALDFWCRSTDGLSFSAGIRFSQSMVAQVQSAGNSTSVFKGPLLGQNLNVLGV